MLLPWPGLAWITVDLLTTVPTEILRRRGPIRSSHGRRWLNDSLKVEGEKGMWFVDHEPPRAFCEEHGTLPFVYSGLAAMNIPWLGKRYMAIGAWLQIPSDKVPG